MHELLVGVCKVSLHLRHAQTLKDKRQIIKSLVQKLKNQGFSVTECGYADNPKQSVLGFSYAGHSYPDVERAVGEGMRLFVGEFEVLRANQDIFDYSEEEQWQPEQEEDAL